MIQDEKDLVLAYIKLTGLEPTPEIIDEITLPISEIELSELLKSRAVSVSLRLQFIELGGEKGYLDENDFKRSPHHKIMFRNLAAGDRMMFKEFKSIIEGLK
jgi:hypothetical protein